MKLSHFCAAAVLAGSVALSAGCSEGIVGGTFVEPVDMMDGYYVDFENGYYKAVSNDGTPVFAGERIVGGDGREYDGKWICFTERVSCSVGGFFRIGDPGMPYNYGRQYLLSDKLDGKGNLVFIGPFYSVGLFFDDLAPATRYNDRICYINKQGEAVFYIEDKLGFPVKKAGNFLAGLSVFEAHHKMAGEVYGAIDKQGSLIIEPKYDYLNYIGGGLWNGREVIITKDSYHLDDSTNVMNNKGETLFKVAVSDGYPDFSGSYGVVGTKRKGYYPINRKGERLPVPEGCELTGIHHNGLFAVKNKDRKVGIINARGEYYAYPQFDGIPEISENHVVTDFEKEYHLHAKTASGLELSHFNLGGRRRNQFFLGDYICLDESHFYSTSGDYLNGYMLPRNNVFVSREGFLHELIYSHSHTGKEPQPVGICSNIDEMYVPSDDLRTFGLFGNVKSCKEYAGGYLSVSYDFDEKGNLVACNGKALNDETVTRDSDGRIVRLAVADEYEVMYYEYEYNDDGTVRSKKDSYGGYYEYEYCSQGLPIRHTSYWEDSILKYKYQYGRFDYRELNWSSCRYNAVDHPENDFTLSRSFSYY